MWTREQFLQIMNSEIATQLFSDPDIFQLVKNWNQDNKACLLHSNGITENFDRKTALDLLRLIAAFAKKDCNQLTKLVKQGISVGARLDYFLPLYDHHYGAGEDIFVCATKIMLGGNDKQNITLKPGQMKHISGLHSNLNYTENELKELESYINNSFEIRKILQSAINKSVVQPTVAAIDYVVSQAKTYRDTNNNPVIVFIPGAINIENRPLSQLIRSVVNNGGNVHDIGFFGSMGIVWSIILGDVEATKMLSDLHKTFNITDEMGNKTPLAWALATIIAVNSNTICVRKNKYIGNLLKIINLLQQKGLQLNDINYTGMQVLDYCKQHYTQSISFFKEIVADREHSSGREPFNESRSSSSEEPEKTSRKMRK